MLDICLSGNCFWDDIFLVDNFPKENKSNKISNIEKNIGGIFNLEKIISKNTDSFCLYTTVGIDKNGLEISRRHNNKSKYHIDLKKGKTTYAAIVSDTKKSTRTSMVHWGVGTKHITSNPEKCKWHHVSYLDTLYFFDKKQSDILKNKSEILTVDFCLSDHTDIEKERILSFLENTDGIICSDIEIVSIFGKSDIKDCMNDALKYVDFCLIHKPDSCLFGSKHKGISLIKKETIKGLNTLGAGDFFCANFIIDFLKIKDFKKSIENSFDLTKKTLIERTENGFI